MFKTTQRLKDIRWKQKRLHTLKIRVDVISVLTYEGTCRRRCDIETKQERNNRDSVSVVTRHLARAL